MAPAEARALTLPNPERNHLREQRRRVNGRGHDGIDNTAINLILRTLKRLRLASTALAVLVIFGDLAARASRTGIRIEA